ncbi:MAG TPA: DUF4125 family protein [Syntrophorhabdaceae bacterium]|nr:DUF4125 family protein [Syntrophorhabdaceae bacterium]
MTKDDLIQSIIDIEWRMFQNVRNAGGRAPCQDDRHTFSIMRKGQAESWSEAALDSYLQDLNRAEKTDRNLMTEKYARMMRSTSPLEYRQIEHLLPSLTAEANEYIEKILPIVLEWEMELLGKYPAILKQGRPIHSSDDSLFVTSLETYLKSELSTYSTLTLKLCWEHVSLQKEHNINGSEITLLHTIRNYGYQTLAEANEKLDRPQ